LQGIWDTSDGQCVVMLQTKFEKLFEKIDLTVLNRYLSVKCLCDYRHRT